jgi:hypothetical protein
MTSTRGLPFTAAKGVVNGVHGNSTGLRTNTLPTISPGFPDFDQFSFGVAHHT